MTASTELANRTIASCRWSKHWPRLLLAFLMLSGLCGDPYAANPPAPPVVVASTEKRPIIEQVPLAGTVTSPRVTRLSPEVAGLIQRILVDAGDRVEQGQLLVELEPTLLGLEVDAAGAATAQAGEELDDAQRRLNDAQRLVKSRGIAETELQARLSEVRADTATLRLREAEQRRAEERLRRLALKAPFAGVISEKFVEVGEWVAPGDEVVELVADQGLRIDFRVPQGYYPQLKKDTAIEVRLEALPDRSIDARIGEIVPVSDPSARTFLLRVYPTAAHLPLTPGMSATGLLKLKRQDEGIVVSRDALLRHADGRVTVWVVSGDGEQATVEERQVKTGLAFDARVVIEHGLEVGTRVVVEGNESLQQGQRVNIREERR